MLHVTNGGSVAGSLRATSLGGETLSWEDVLCEGPVPVASAAELRAVRARFLAGHSWENEVEILRTLERRDALFAEVLRSGRQVVLWFEHDVFDQLQLLQVLAQADELGFDPARLELINVGAFEGKPDFAGLGELDPPELASLWSLRRPVLVEQAKLASAGWAAVRATDPTAIEGFLETDTSALPFLAAALCRFLEQLPDTMTGLSRSESQLLQLLADAPRTPPQLFRENQELEEATFDGDLWVWQRLAALGRGEQALVEPVDGGEFPVPPPRGEGRTFAAARFAITETGRDVLAGRADRVEVLGIDRWVGGTHLRPGHVPRWDRSRKRVVAASPG
jgi:hypothetical protein